MSDDRDSRNRDPDDDLDAREKARAQRRDRDAQAEQRAPMRPGLGKVFKQIQDAQQNVAKKLSRENPTAGNLVRERAGKRTRTGRRPV